METRRRSTRNQNPRASEKLLDLTNQSMETRKRSSRKLGLEAPEEIRHKGKRVLKSGSENENGEMKKLYVFFTHTRCSEYVYSIYALDIPSPGSIVKATTTVTRTTTIVNGKVKKTTDVIYSELERSPVEPILRFSRSEWPLCMACTRLGSKLYFLGGDMGNFVEGETVSYPREVNILDLSSSSSAEIPSSMRDRPKEVLKRGPLMHTGKSWPVVAFVADGKIFVVSGVKKNCPVTGNELKQFEIFDPSVGAEGEWEVVQTPPPFHDAFVLSVPLMVDRKAFFAGYTKKNGGFTCCYDIDMGTWSSCALQTRLSPSTDFSYGDTKLGSQLVGETLWNVCRHPKTDSLVATSLNIGKNAEKKRKGKKKNNYFDVVRYYIDSSGRESRVLTRVGDSRLCFLQVAFADEVDLDKCHMSVTLFDVSGNGDSAEYLTSAHFVVEANGIPHYVAAAHAV